ncbi:Cytidylate kinase [Desulfurobacterium thermolithotrophum DSM 11699]|uniref:Cytidylate kinase n=1 Tax=Desulfurobacterium thermolithotrophum (strain DSM 11699 / BSA) TaxID=868864 RepID=F0S2J0_DESTD|nr:(d)CMP kinase [Desulfurobacterium thermolithotrophum]ADY73062.1 Cytidylate kinase [Desulfurobacterium thermolithotrophum DSM 11699]
MKDIKIITIDGPAGAGKSSIAKEIAKRFGFTHLDSGAIYRTIGIACKKAGVNLENEKEVLEVAKKIRIELKEGKVFLNGNNVTEEIRTPEGGMLASKVAQFKEVREIVVKILRELAKGKKIVIDGRDAGTYIFPEADLKIYLTASPEERARRRYKELLKRGFNVSFNDILKEVIERDKRDKNRKFAPLVIPDGAVIIDTTEKNLEEVLLKIFELINFRN